MKRFCPILLGAVLTACGEFGPLEDLPRELSIAETKLIEADNRFALKLFREVNAQSDPGTNVFISPLSVGMALGMTYNGASGTTQESMQQALELEGMTLQDVNESYESLIALLRGLDSRRCRSHRRRFPGAIGQPRIALAYPRNRLRCRAAPKRHGRFDSPQRRRAGHRCQNPRR